MSDAVPSRYDGDEVLDRSRQSEKSELIHDLNSKLLDIIRDLQSGVESTHKIKILIKLIDRLSSDIKDMFLKYCHERIENYNDVIIFTNYENMICQVQIEDPTRVNTIEDSYYRNEYVEIQHNDIVEVFDEDEQNYYGIHNGNKVFTSKDNCTIVESLHPITVQYFVMNHTIANKILLKILSINKEIIQHKCKLLLFEYLKWEGLNRGTFYLAHNHAGDEFHSLGGMCPGCEGITNFPTKDELILTIFEPYTNRYNETETHKRSIGFMYYHTERYSFENILWQNFINLLRWGRHLNNSYLHRIDDIPIIEFSKMNLIQNFKCLFAKSRVEEIELNKDINDALMKYYPQIGLIDLFIPDIKFILRMKYLFDIRKRIPLFNIDEYTLNQWNNYCEMNTNMRHVNPAMYLNYLFTTVLQDAINTKVYSNIIMSLNTLILPLIDQMVDSKKPNYGYFNVNKMIISIIDRIITKKNLFGQQKAGAIVARKKSKKQQKNKRSNQKKSRKYNKKGGIAVPPLYIVYCKIMIDIRPKYEIIYIANSMESARIMSNKLINIDNIKPHFYTQLLNNENNLVHTIIPNEPLFNPTIEVITPLKAPSINDGSDKNMLYFICNENGIVECLYDNLEIARRHHPGRDFRQIPKNTINLDSVVFQ